LPESVLGAGFGSDVGVGAGFGDEVLEALELLLEDPLPELLLEPPELSELLEPPLRWEL